LIKEKQRLEADLKKAYGKTEMIVFIFVGAIIWG
jgi:hypothetical protein